MFNLLPPLHGKKCHPKFWPSSTLHLKISNNTSLWEGPIKMILLDLLVSIWLLHYHDIIITIYWLVVVVTSLYERCVNKWQCESHVCPHLRSSIAILSPSSSSLASPLSLSSLYRILICDLTKCNNFHNHYYWPLVEAQNSRPLS